MRTESEVMRASKVVKTTEIREASKLLTFDDFKPNPDLSENKRAAEFIDWCARNMPGRFIPYQTRLFQAEASKN